MVRKKVKKIVISVVLILGLIIGNGCYFFNLNGELEEFAFMWFITQILIAPAYFTIINLLKIKE